MATKCWFCEHVASCKKYQCGGCENFSKFQYSIREMASLLGFTERTIFRWLKKSESYALAKIKKILGIDFEVLREDVRRVGFQKKRH